MPPQISAALAVFLGVSLLTGLLVNALLQRRSPMRRRLEQLTSPESVATAVTTVLVEAPPASAQNVSRLIPKSPSEMSRLQKRLARAGFHSPYAPALYSLVELGLPALTVAAAIYFGGTGRNLVLALLAGVIAYLIPGFALSMRVEKRKKLISRGLADALDLLIVCVEAGLGLDQAIQKAGDELEVSHPALAEELRMITTETRAGKPRMEAFKNFAERTKVEDIKSLVAMITQTDRFGTSIAQALRTFADTLRTKRRQEAEERAAKLGVKLVFPLVFCLFPAMYVVTLGPALIQIVRVLIQQVAGR